MRGNVRLHFFTIVFNSACHPEPPGWLRVPRACGRPRARVAAGAGKFVCTAWEQSTSVDMPQVPLFVSSSQAGTTQTGTFDVRFQPPLAVPEFGISNYTWTFGHMGNMFMCCLEMYTWTHMNEPTTNVKLLMHCHHRGLKNSRMPPPCLGRFAALAAGVRLGVGAEANVAADDVLGLIACTIGVPSSTCISAIPPRARVSPRRRAWARVSSSLDRLTTSLAGAWPFRPKSRI